MSTNTAKTPRPTLLFMVSGFSSQVSWQSLLACFRNSQPSPDRRRDRIWRTSLVSVAQDVAKKNWQTVVVRCLFKANFLDSQMRNEPSAAPRIHSSTHQSATYEKDTGR
eukprot:scaffold524060_cov41-Prasinocladus_malaysianus.AAC.2